MSSHSTRTRTNGRNFGMDGTTHGYTPCANGSDVRTNGEGTGGAGPTGHTPVLLDEVQPIRPAFIEPSYPERSSRGEWPLSTYVAYGPLADSVSTARTRTRVILHEWGPTLAELVDDTLLVVSELVGNAVTASRAMSEKPPVRLWLQSDWSRILVMVGDESSRPPLRLAPSLDAEHGRGLMTVEGVSSGWGWYPTTTNLLAKVVWALIGGYGE
jgi:anti-sigma regulatory factor (Ser/Thr protein kinase)